MLKVKSMKTTDVVQYFGSQAATARALGITTSAVNQWKEQVPLATAARLEKLTHGALVLDISRYARPNGFVTGADQETPR